MQAGGAAARAELGLTDNYYDTSAGQRERMLKTTEKLDKTGNRIQQGRAQLAETEVGPLLMHNGQTSCRASCGVVHAELHEEFHQQWVQQVSYGVFHYLIECHAATLRTPTEFMKHSLSMLLLAF